MFAVFVFWCNTYKKYLQKHARYDKILLAVGKVILIYGSMVKWLRHRPFTAVTGVQIPLESFETNVYRGYADVAQLAEQLICNQQVIGSSPIIGFI